MVDFGKRIWMSLVFCVMMGTVKAQFTYGTTGLLQMPTADMQKDKTFMFGGSYLEAHATPARWFYDTLNYYINITIFPWLEVGYDCTLHKAMYHDPAYGDGYWIPHTYGKFVNQDRSFHFRLRIWKEGWWKQWTPQIVLGANDPTTGSWKGGGSTLSDDNMGNGYYSRYYIALTKHLPLKNAGRLGLHVAYVYNRRKDYPLNGLAIGTNFRFQLPGNQPLTKVVNNLNLMAEYDSRTLNLGAEYSFWKDYINAVIEFNRCRYLSAGLVFKIHLK